VYYFDLDSCFYKYLEAKRIIKISSFSYQIRTKDIDAVRIYNQLKVINEFHNRTLGYTGYMNKRLNNNLGRTIEQYKMYIKWLKRDLEEIKISYDKSEFKRIVGEVGKGYLEKAKKCIENIYENNYLCLLKRSMSRNEVCLKNISFNNLRMVQDTIEVINLDGCCYNMVEMDAVGLLKRLRRKSVDIDTYDVISNYCNISHLDKDSLEFMLSILNYPYEFMKCCNKYRYRINSLPEKVYIDELKKIISK
jgi:hypothetical protein